MVCSLFSSGPDTRNIEAKLLVAVTPSNTPPGFIKYNDTLIGAYLLTLPRLRSLLGFGSNMQYICEKFGGSIESAAKMLDVLEVGDGLVIGLESVFCFIAFFVYLAISTLYTSFHLV